MKSLLNNDRPPVFCPGCSHEKVVHALDQALVSLNLQGSEIAIVSDIGCSGLFDTFFNTHALHGLHGRALTYATGLKLARPDLHVITIMGDGGLGIGGAHVLSSCRRNLDLTLLVLNNFNYGMTGGQCSATTPAGSQTSSGYLNHLEASLDICTVGKAAGAPYVKRILYSDTELVAAIKEAVSYKGFSITDIWGICPGRFSRRNKSTVSMLSAEITRKPEADGVVEENSRLEFGEHFRSFLKDAPAANSMITVDRKYDSSPRGRTEILFLGAAGQRINTAGEILCLSAMSGGLNATLKSDYPITVLRGHSICETVLSSEPVNYTGIKQPDVIVAIAQEGVNRRKPLFSKLDQQTIIFAAEDVSLPENSATIFPMDFRSSRVTKANRALASLAAVSSQNSIITTEMLFSGLSSRFAGNVLKEAETTVRTFLETL